MPEILLVLLILESSHTDGAVIAIIGLGLILIILGFMTAAGFILLVNWIRKKKFILDDSMPDRIPQGEVLKTVYLNPGVMVLFAVEILGIIADLFNIDLHLG